MGIAVWRRSWSTRSSWQVAFGTMRAKADLSRAFRLLRVEARSDQTRNTVDLHRFHESPFLRRPGLTRFRKHVVNPSRSFRFGGTNDGIVKQLPVRVFLTPYNGSLARREGRIQ